MWFNGVEVAQETSAPPPKKILDPPLRTWVYRLTQAQLRPIEKTAERIEKKKKTKEQINKKE